MTNKTEPQAHAHTVGQAASDYFDRVASLLVVVRERESKNIQRAARTIADSLVSGGMVHAIGTGHSHMLAEELFYRAGGLVRVNPVLINDLMLHENASGSTARERESGRAARLIADHPIEADDVVIAISNSGGSTVAVEFCELAGSQGAKTIAITSLSHATSSQARSRNGKRLHEVVDIVLDNHGVPGDASIKLPGVPELVGPTSTVVGVAMLQATIVEAVALLSEAGEQVELFRSSNTEGGDAINDALIDRYRGTIRCL